MAKLDPDNVKTAKDVMDERAAVALKRKREEEGGTTSDVDVDFSEKPKEGLMIDDRRSKKRKIVDKSQLKAKAEEQTDKDPTEDSQAQRKRRKAEQKAAKRERKQAKVAKANAKRERQKARAQDAISNEPQQATSDIADESGEDGKDSHSDGDTEMVEAIDINGESASTVPLVEASSISPSPTESPILSPQPHSGTSSTSSIVPPLDSVPIKLSQPSVPATPGSTNASGTSLSAKERLEARQRLEAAINEKRAARKAYGPDGRAPRNRQELLEARRKKEEERRIQKKEQRRKAKEEEARKQDEEIARRFSPGGSGSLLASPRSPMEPSNNFSFGRVAFGDGSQADATLSSLTDQRRRKGPADPATALKAAQSKKSRLSGLDEEKRSNIEEKDMWLNAKKRAHGERVRDDTSLLKKALKRQEGAKKKSGKEWQERIEGVAKGQHIRQKKREDNLRRRKEEKGSKGKKNKSTKVKRPGFEGSFKGRTGGGKKK